MVSSNEVPPEVGLPQTDRQTDRQADRQTGRQADRQTDTHIFHLVVIHKELLEFLVPILALTEQAYIMLGRTHVTQPLLGCTNLEGEEEERREKG